MERSNNSLFFSTKYPISVSVSSAQSMDRLHGHDYIQFFSLRSGMCTHYLDDEAMRMRNNEIAIVPAFNMHSIDGRHDDYKLWGLDIHSALFQPGSDESWNFFNMCIEPLGNTVLHKTPVFLPNASALEEITRLCDEFSSLSSNCANEKIPLIRGKSIEFISLITSEYSAREGAVLGNAMTGYSPSVYKAFNYIHQNFRNEIYVNKIAQDSMISLRSLYRLFEENMGMSIHQYIQYLRLNYAKALLRETNRTVFDIANSSGFEHIPNFYRFFKNRTGMSPNEYREKFYARDDKLI